MLNQSYLAWYLSMTFTWIPQYAIIVTNYLSQIMKRYASPFLNWKFKLTYSKWRKLKPQALINYQLNSIRDVGVSNYLMSSIITKLISVD